MLWRSRGPGSVGAAWWVFVAPSGDPALPRPARARRRRDRAVRRDSVSAARPRRGGTSRRSARCSPGLRALGGRAAAAASGCPALHPFGQTWSLAIEWYFYLLWPLRRARREVRGVTPGPTGRRQPGRRRAALPRGAAAERLLVLLRSLGTLRRAARRAPPWRCGSRPAALRRRHAAPATLGRGSRLVAIAVDHRVRPGRAQPALPLRRGAGRGARDRGAHLHRLQQRRRPRPPAARATPGWRPSGGAATASTSGTSCRCCCSRRPICGLPRPVLGLITVAPTVALTVAQLPVPGASVPAAPQRRPAAGTCHRGLGSGPVRQAGGVAPGPDAPRAS